ncbi:hypothetical protein Tco_0474586 [Tanacetum coccineum]
MGDENPIRTLGDYSKPSHEGYRNTIDLPVGNNVVPLRSDTIRLVQNRCSFHGLRSEDPNQHLKDFLKLVDSLDLDGRTSKLCNDILMFQQHHGESLLEAWTRFKDLLQKVHHHGIDLWLQATIEELARYEEEGWNNPVALGKGSLDYENPNIKQLLGVMKCKVDALMKEAISLMGRSKSVFGMTSNTVYQLLSEPSRREEFEHVIMNFVLDQEERIRQLEDYMQSNTDEFMEFSLEVT